MKPCITNTGCTSYRHKSTFFFVLNCARFLEHINLRHSISEIIGLGAQDRDQSLSDKCAVHINATWEESIWQWLSHHGISGVEILELLQGELG